MRHQQAAFSKVRSFPLQFIVACLADKNRNTKHESVSGLRSGMLVWFIILISVCTAADASGTQANKAKGLENVLFNVMSTHVNEL